MALFKILLFLNLVFFVVQFDCRDSTAISADPDEDVPLDCFDPKLLNTENCYRVKWVKYMSDSVSPKIILTWPKKSSNIHDDDRVKWLADKQSKYLLLTKVKKSDEGLYGCEIFSGWERIVSKNFSLKVKDCQTTVKKASPGSPVTLDCSEASPQNLSWSVLKGGNPVPLSTERFQRNGGNLSLSSVLASDSAWYRCEYRHGDIQRCIDINLLVQDPSTAFTTTPDIITAQILQSESGGGFFTTVLTVSVILVIVVMCALVGAAFYWKYKKYKKAPQQTPEYQDVTEYDAVFDAAYDVAYDLAYDAASTTVNDFSPPDEFTNYPSLQQHFHEEEMCTF